jgi:cytochrome oxidase Cu insertion factor (SCO1/SenC/PrrC family)
MLPARDPSLKESFSSGLASRTPFSTAGALALAILALELVAPAIAWAHRFGGPNDPCERKIGSSLIHITLYQPQFDPDAEYCDEVPREGDTVLVVDVLGDELRKVPMGLEVIATGDSQAPRTILSVPPKVYRRGVADAQMLLTADSPYLARVTLAGNGVANSQVLSFPIRVRSWYRALIMPSLMVLGVIALTAISVIRYHLSSGRPRSPRRAARAHLRLAGVALACCLLIAGCARRTVETRRPTLPDVQLVDDHGQPVSLGSLRGKVVVLQFIHIGCPGVCDNLVNKFGQIADKLGPDLGSKVVLLSISNDPENDTPDKLLALARSREADLKGWLFVTGKAGAVDRVIKAFGLHNERLPDGSPNHITRVFLLGPDLRARHEYAGMAMDLHSVGNQIKETLETGKVS